MELRIGQINAQRSSAAATELEILIQECNIDILCIQEPYNFMSKVRGYNSKDLKIIQPEGKTPWVAAALKHTKFNILVFPSMSEHILFFKVYTSACDFYIINLYCQFSLQLDNFLQLLHNILDKIRGEKYIITVDSNSKSELWYAKETDDRGKLFVDFILENNLIILNEVSNPPTFMTAYCQSNIDITLVSPNFSNSIKDWKVNLNCATSDHNLITFSIIIDDQNKTKNFNRMIKPERPFNLKRADWEQFNKNIKEKFTHGIKEKLETNKPDSAVKLFNKTLTSCCQQSIPRKSVKANSVPWWTEELKMLKNNVNKNKKQLTRAKKLNFTNLIPEYELKFKIARNRYVATIRRTKKQTWRNFVTRVGNDDPWSIIYKIIRNKINKEEFLSSIILPSGDTTKSWKETVNILLDKCVPEDLENETEQQRILIMNNDQYINYNLEPEITHDEIFMSIKKCKKRKAPGADGFQSELILKIWQVDKSILYNLYNNCMRNSIFPKEWKTAILKIILKNPTKDKFILSSYRPIALLSTVGKIFERILIERIQTLYNENKLENECQYGFRKQKSTEDALIAFKSAVNSTNKKYVIGLFFDIDSAFDGLWWPAIINRLTKANCSSNMINLIKNYFKNRKVIVKSKFESINKMMQKGCPQGSIIGPMAWGWCLDTFLDSFQEKISNRDAEVIAYADDLVMIIKGTSRKNLEYISKRGIDTLLDWCNTHKLKISINKTFALHVKGKLDSGRLPIIKMEDSRIRFTTEIKYLGVILDNKLNFIMHAKYIRSKTINFIMALRRVSRDSWGLKSGIIRVLYNAVFIPIVNYGSGIWFEEVQKTHFKRHLYAAQRSILLILTRACRTVSTAALQVIAGTLPIDLEIIKQALIRKIKNNKTIRWKNYEYIQRNNIQNACETHSINNEIEKIKRIIYDEWQTRWNSDMRGRSTFNFIHDVRFKMNNDWFNPNRFCTYLITGYGPINSTLFKRNCVNNKYCLICDLEEEEDIKHILFRCPKYNQFRYSDILNANIELEKLIESKEKFEKFSKFAVMVFEERSKILTSLESRHGSASTSAGTVTSG